MIVMTTVARNEAGMIAAFIHNCFAVGFDHVIVTDNGSDDGTKDILRDLAKVLPVTVHDDDGEYQQQATTMKMANEAIERLGATWLAAFDVDELIVVPDGRPLKEHLGVFGDDAVLVLERTNLFPSRELAETYDWRRDPAWRGICRSRVAAGHYDPAVAMEYPFFAHILPPKVLFRTRGLEWISTGGHDVRLKPSGQRIPSDLELWHFPWRGMRHVREAIERRIPEMRNEPNPNNNAKYRRWARMLADGRPLEDVIAEILPTESEVPRLLELGVVTPAIFPDHAAWRDD